MTLVCPAPSLAAEPSIAANPPRCAAAGASVHLVGIGGSGMRALATVLGRRGWQVSGSDSCRSSCAELSAAGLRTSLGQAAGNVPADASLVVYSEAVPRDNVELRRAVELRIPTLAYGAMLGRVMTGSRRLAVAGTHGKSTTTAMAAEILIAAGLDPTVLCGAESVAGGSGGRSGDGDLVLIEACEYRGNFLHLQPTSAVLTGIEPDHFDCYPTAASLEQAFGRFVERIPRDGLLVVPAQCPSVGRVAERARCRRETFGLTDRADWQAADVRCRGGRCAFSIHRGGRRFARVRLQVIGRHNVQNALAAAALAEAAGAAAADVAAGLGRFAGLRRRLEPLGVRRGVAVWDDYAHHPTAVAAAIEAVRQTHPAGQIWVVFEPHQVSRTTRLLDEFAGSLRNADHLAVTEIFRAREPLLPGEVSAADLAAGVRRLGGDVLADRDPRQILRRLEMACRPGDVVVTMGAGEIWKLSHAFANRI